MLAATKEEEDRLQEQATAAEGGEEKEELEGENPERCFRKVDRRIRSVLQHNKHLPSVSENCCYGDTLIVAVNNNNNIIIIMELL